MATDQRGRRLTPGRPRARRLPLMSDSDERERESGRGEQERKREGRGREIELPAVLRPTQGTNFHPSSSSSSPPPLRPFSVSLPRCTCFQVLGLSVALTQKYGSYTSFNKMGKIRLRQQAGNVPMSCEREKPWSVYVQSFGSFGSISLIWV